MSWMFHEFQLCCTLSYKKYYPCFCCTCVVLNANVHENEAFGLMMLYEKYVYIETNVTTDNIAVNCGKLGKFPKGCCQ